MLVNTINRYGVIVQNSVLSQRWGEMYKNLHDKIENWEFAEKIMKSGCRNWKKEFVKKLGLKRIVNKDGKNWRNGNAWW